MEKAPFPNKASSLRRRGWLGPSSVVPSSSSPFLLYLFRSLGGCQLAPILMKVFCVVNICPLASGQGPSPFHKKHQTAVRWSWVWVNTKWTQSSLPLGRRGPTSSYPSPDGPSLQVLTVTVSTFPNSWPATSLFWRSAHLGWVAPELTTVCLGANDQFGPCFSSLITQLLACLSLHLRAVGVGIGIYFPIHSLCCLVVQQLLKFCEKQVLKPVNQFDIFSLLV